MVLVYLLMMQDILWLQLLTKKLELKSRPSDIYASRSRLR